MTTKKEMIIASNGKTDSNDASKQPILVFDLIRSILERLSFADFHRARCVSSEWYSASKSCIGRVINPTNPWLVLFPKEQVESKNINGSCKLFDPSDDSSYTVRDLGFDLSRSHCLASCGCWFLMLDRRTNFYILNVITRERISLPSLESTDKKEMIFKRTGDCDFCVTLHYKPINKGKFSYRGKNTSIGKAVLWVDEKSKDYLVVWSYDKFFIYQKKGDHDNNIWKVLEPLKNEGCVRMVLKESKLYVHRENRDITVFDFFGGDSPMECAIFPSPPSDYHLPNDYSNLAVTLSGEVLFISNRGSYFFNVYKMDPESSIWSMIKSLGDEALLLDQGITVAAKDGVVTKNCIYFANGQYGRYGFQNNKPGGWSNVLNILIGVQYLSRMLVGSSPLLVENSYFKKLYQLVFSFDKSGFFSFKL